jgi:SAM-dependent methyltransferase
MPLSYPPPDVYEKEYVYWPWGKLIGAVAALVAELAPQGGSVLDYMCGTGYLLNRVALLRPDLHLIGCSSDPDYIAYGRGMYPQIELAHADAVTFRPPSPVDVAVCTGGIHHLTVECRRPFLTRVMRALGPAGWFVVGEEVLSSHTDELARRHAVMELSGALLRHSIDSGAPPEVLEAGLAVLEADLLQRGEYKLTEEELRCLLQEHINVVSVQRCWPDDPSLLYGDRIVLCGPASAAGARS